ncbi:MAG: carboxypeptidase-like regulatory domain-containing protein, partial [Muribaculaceae bacterium]|nr:carboxypeptidase-like regulatory domain-containing protein [Muribaculaceae bacterium]
MKLLRFICFVLMMLVGVASVTADNVKISGKVIDNEDKPIEFATVRISGTAIGTNTDLQGLYELKVAEKDTIEVVFTCVGFKEHHRKLLNPKGEVTLNVRMELDSYTIGEVEVTEFRRSSDGMQSFGTDVLKTSPDVSGGSVEAMISTMAGVNSSNEMSSQYSVRGGSYDENSVYINGVEIYRPQLVRSGQQEGLSIINPDMVGNIKFSTGGFPAQYSDKMSSVLDITYREPEALEGSASFSLMGASLAFGQNSGKFSQLHGIRFKKNNSLLTSLETKGEYDPLYFDYQTSINYKPTDKWTISVL